MSTLLTPPPSCPGSAVVHVRSSDWCAVGRVGPALLPVGHRLLHLRPDPPDEAQPLVRLTLSVLTNEETSQLA